MRTITVSKERLLTALTENRDKHRDEFLRAQEVFRQKVIDTLDERLRLAREGGRVELTIRLPEPVDYTDSFDTAISMVEWAQGDTMDLDETDFERYVLNKWEWARNFAASTQSYLS